MNTATCDYPGCTRTDTEPVMDWSEDPPRMVPLCPDHSGPAE